MYTNRHHHMNKKLVPDASKDAADDFNENNMGTGSFSFDSSDDPHTKEENGDMTFCMSNYSKESMKMMFMMRSHHMLTDVVLEVNDELFHAHKIVLSAGSPYFKAMFTGGLKESEMSRVRLQGVCSTAMGRILYFMYSGHIRITELTVCQLLPAATMFQVPNVIDACCAFLERQLDPTNAIGIASFAEQHGCLTLKQRANQFIERHFTQICLEEEFLQLSAIQLIQLIRKDELNVQEEREVYNAVLKWVKYDEDSRYPKMENILVAVRCQFLTPTFLKEQMSNCAVLKKVPACREYLERIFKDLTLHKRSVVRERKPNTTRMIFISGGYYRHSLDILEAFNVDDHTWTTLPTMRVPRSGLGAAFLKGQFYAVGGRNNSPGSSYDSDWVDRYDPVTEDWRPCVPMSVPRNRVGVAVMDELLYAVGGSAGSEYHNSVEHYDPELNRWTLVKPMNYRRLGVGITVVNRLMYAIGGFDGKDRLKTCECYHPENNEWTIIAPMNVGRSGAGVAALNQYIYVVGGFDGSRQLSSVERYDTEHGVWDIVASIDIARSALSLTVLDGKLYAMGGFDGQSFLNIVEVYDPEFNKWEEGTPLTTGRSGHASAVIYQPACLVAPTYMDCADGSSSSSGGNKSPSRADGNAGGAGGESSSSASSAGGRRTGGRGKSNSCNTMHTLSGTRCHICNSDASDTGQDHSFTAASISARCAETGNVQELRAMPPPTNLPPQINNRQYATPSLSYVAPSQRAYIPSSPSEPSLSSHKDKKRMRVNSFNSIDVIPAKIPIPMDEHAAQQLDNDDPKKFKRIYIDPAEEGPSTSKGAGSSSSSSSSSTFHVALPGASSGDSDTAPMLDISFVHSHGPDDDASASAGALSTISRCNKDNCSVIALKNNLQRRFRAFVSGKREPSQDGRSEPSNAPNASSTDEDMET